MSFSWNDARQLDSLCYDLVLGDWPRGQNRARIQNLANGAPPYTQQEAEENGIEVNINDLSHTRLCHDGRTQFYNSFLKTGNFFRLSTDAGAAHKRSERGAIATAAINKPMKRSIAYFERMRSAFGMLVLHGISPGAWENQDRWCPRPQSVEDVLIPSKTLLGFENLPFFVLRRSFTGVELQRITNATKRDPGWRMPLVQRCLEWLGGEMTQLRSTHWQEVWSPEKLEERVKENGGYFLCDQAPMLDVFDVYGWVDNGDGGGWVRRIVLDSWTAPALSGGQVTMQRKTDSPLGKDKWAANDFLFSSGSRHVAKSWQEIVSFQFADLSAQFPARYHSVRSLGWLTYASCHLGNRLRCKFYESVFEALMQYYKVRNAEDVANAIKLNLVNRGFIDETIKPVPAADRWQVNAGLVELGLNDNAAVTQRNASSFTTNNNFSQDRTEKTRFQVMAELQATQQLVSAAINQAYMYQAFEYREILRRFCKPRSTDPDVRSFQAACLRQGIPEKYLHDPEAWEVETERVMGGGSKTLEMTIAAQLMEWRDKFDPEPQRQILRDAVMAITDDPARATSLVPDAPVNVTSGTHDAELTAASLMAGIKVNVLTGVNHIEVIETLLRIMSEKIAAANQAGGMMSAQDLNGMQNMANHIGEHIAILAQDPEEKQRVSQYQGFLGKLMNLLKAFAQRLQEAAQKQAEANGNGGIDPKDQARVDAIRLQAETKAKIAQDSHAQRTAQRQIQFEQQLEQKQQSHAADLQAKDLEAASTIKRKKFTGLEE